MSAPRARRGRRALCAALLLAAGAAGCGAAALRTSEGRPAPVRAAASSWARVEPVRTFGPDNLYQEIDGEAELFLPYGFRELSVEVLAPAGRPAAQLRVERFRLGSRRDAFGVYSRHRFPGQELARAGPSEAIVSDASLDFYRGDVFVRIRASGPGVGRAELLRLGEETSARLAGAAGPTPEAQLLDLPGLVPGSVVYQKQALLGYEALAPGYEARVERGGAAGSVVLIPPADPPRETRALLAGLPDAAADGEGRYRATLRSGPIRIAERGGYRVGAAGPFPPDAAEALLRELQERLSRFLEAGGAGRE